MLLGPLGGLFGTRGLAFSWRGSRHGRPGLFRCYARGQQEKVLVEAGRADRRP